MKEQPPELFAERPVRSQPMRRGLPYAVRRLLTVLVLLSIVGGGLYWKLGSHTAPPPGDIPTIKAEITSYKQRPEQPGGIDIPHQDIQVYQEIDGHGSLKQEAEHLLPPPETPQIAAVAPPAMTSLTQPQIESLITSTPKPDTPLVDPAPTVPVTPVPVTSPVANVPILSDPAPPAPSPTQSPKPTPPTIDSILHDVTTPAKNGSLIQLASVSDQSAAQITMKKLQSKYANILGTTHLHLVEADLGQKGVYYRVQSQSITAHARERDLRRVKKS